jgi:hypothetical protein
MVVSLTSPTPRRAWDAFLKAARMSVCLLVVALGVSAGNNAVANGVPKNLPSGPFMNQSAGDFRLLYSETWHTLRISPKTSMEVGVLFTPIPNYSFSRILGVGWQLPAVESTLLPVNDREYEMILPTGHRERLERTKSPNQLQGAGWIATISGRDIVVKSSCGNELRYQAGRLKFWKTADGVTVEFHRNEQGAYWITGASGQTLLTLKPAYDTTTTQKNYHLHLQGGKHAVLRYGVRPILVKTSEKNSFGQPKEKEQNIETLVSVQWDGEPERKYGFAMNEMNATGELFRWDNGSQKLIRRGADTFEFVKIQGVNCLKTSRNGKVQTIFGSDYRTRMRVSQMPGTPLTLTETLVIGGKELGPKKIWRIKEDSSKELLRQYWYGAEGTAIRMLDNANGKSILYKKEKRLESAIDARTREVIWQKEYDEKHRLSRFLEGGKQYAFDYGVGGDRVKIIRTFQNETLEAVVPLSQISNFSSIPQ